MDLGNYSQQLQQNPELMQQFGGAPPPPQQQQVQNAPPPPVQQAAPIQAQVAPVAASASQGGGMDGSTPLAQGGQPANAAPAKEKDESTFGNVMSIFKMFMG